jgi:hypothetical protein
MSQTYAATLSRRAKTMSTLSEKLSLRRQTLLAKSQAERLLLGQQVGQIRQTLLLADLGLKIAGKIKQRPVIGLGLIAATIAIKPARMLLMLKTGLTIWQTWQNFAPALKQMQNDAATKQPQ